MSDKRKSVESVFAKIEAVVDIAHINAHEFLGDVLDSVFVHVDNAINAWKLQTDKLLDAEYGDSEPVKVEPDLLQMVKDVDTFRFNASGMKSAWHPYANGEKTIESMTESDAEYTRLNWAHLPEDAKTYGERSPDSPL